jgi:hypothetical protein
MPHNRGNSGNKDKQKQTSEVLNESRETLYGTDRPNDPLSNSMFFQFMTRLDDRLKTIETNVTKSVGALTHSCMHEYASIHNFKQRVSGVRVGVQNFKITSLMIKLSRGSGPKYISEFSFQMLSMKKLYLRQFSTKLCKGMSHEMIIDQLKETIDLDQVKSVQLKRIHACMNA